MASPLLELIFCAHCATYTLIRIAITQQSQVPDIGEISCGRGHLLVQCARMRPIVVGYWG